LLQSGVKGPEADRFVTGSSQKSSGSAQDHVRPAARQCWSLKTTAPEPLHRGRNHGAPQHAASTRRSSARRTRRRSAPRRRADGRAAQNGAKATVRRYLPPTADEMLTPRRGRARDHTHTHYQRRTRHASSRVRVRAARHHTDLRPQACPCSTKRRPSTTKGTGTAWPEPVLARHCTCHERWLARTRHRTLATGQRYERRQQRTRQQRRHRHRHSRG
jgi:hypothetical protein